ncbi:hypothetical protein SCHPADRAFT_793636, partial [Schizopora paradoxa]
EIATKLARRRADKLAEARSEIVLRVEQSQFAHVLSRDPREIWRALEAVHRARGFASALAFRRRLLTMKKRPDQRMSDWIG